MEQALKFLNYYNNYVVNVQQYLTHYSNKNRIDPEYQFEQLLQLYTIIPNSAKNNEIMEMFNHAMRIQLELEN